ncbi:MAG: hypothetical protein ABIH41_03890 [Nanoarchaeota archaeon]
MGLSRYSLILVLVVFFVFSVRVFIAFQTPYLDYEGYGVLRQVEHIVDTGLPLYHDPLSYGGRVRVFSPLYYYVLSFFAFMVSPIVALKIVPNLFLACSVFLVYLVCMQLTKSKEASLLAAAFSSFIPPLLAGTVNSASIYALAIPLMLLVVLSILRLPARSASISVMLFTCLLALTHPIAAALVVGVALWIALLKLESLKVEQYQWEILLFTLFLVAWINFIFYKTAFLAYGLAAVWQNIPTALLSQHFSSIGMLDVIYALGVLPLLLGVYAAYSVFFHHRSRQHFLVIALGLGVLGLLLLRIVSGQVGFMMLGLFLSIISAHTLRVLLMHVRKTKMAWLAPSLLVFFIISFFFTSFVQAVSLSSQRVGYAPSGETVRALMWLRDNSHPYQTVLGSVEEGQMIEYYAQRPTVADLDFLMIPGIESVYGEVSKVYRTQLETEAVGIMNKHGVSYILYSPEHMVSKGISVPAFYSDNTCFALIYEEAARIYNVHCEIR